MSIIKQLLRKKKTINNVSTQYDIVLHIGAPKTGSSAIQYFLLKNTRMLLRHGFYYPKHETDANLVSGGHVDIGHLLIQNDAESARRRIEKHIRTAKKKRRCLLLSAESFFMRPLKMKSLLKDYQVLVVAFFRDPLESIISIYNQYVKKHFFTDTLQKFCKNILSSDAKLPSGRMLDDWAEHFRQEDVHFIPYHADHFSSGHIEYTFLDALGIPPQVRCEFDLYDTAVNKSYCPAALELKRLFNFVLDKDERDINRRIDTCLQRYTDRYETHRIDPCELLGHELFGDLAMKFKESNHTLRKKYFAKAAKDFLVYDFPIGETPFPKALSRVPSLAHVIVDSFDNKKDLIRHIRRNLYEKLSGNHRCYSTMKLADLLNIQRDALDDFSTDIFKKNQIAMITGDKAQSPDILREIAIVLDRYGQHENALRVIERAVELRPNGPMLIKIRDRLWEKEKKTNNDNHH